VRMGRAAFEALGIENEKAVKMAEAFTKMDGRMMLEMADAYDPEVPIEENKVYINQIKDNLEIWQTELNAQMQAIRNDDEPNSD